MQSVWNLLGSLPSWIKQQLEKGIPLGFFKNLSWQYISSVWGVGIGFLYSLVVGRMLGPSEFGLIATALGFTSLVFTLADLRLNEAVIRYIAEFWAKKDYSRTLAFVKLSLVADAISAIIALFITGLIAQFVHPYLIPDSRGLLAIWLSGISIFFTSLASATSIGLLRVFDYFKSYALVSMAGVTVKMAITLVALFVMNWDAIGIISVAVFTTLLTKSTMFGVALWHLNGHIPLRDTPAPISLLRPRLREIGLFVLNNYGLSLSSSGVRHADVNLLSYFTSLEVVGIYKVAKNFISAMWLMVDPAFYVVYPELAKMWADKNFLMMRTFIRRLMLLFGGGGFVLFMIAFMLMPPIIELTLGSDFSEAGQIFRWMLWSFLCWTPLLWIHPILCAAGVPNLSLRAGILANILALILYIIFIPWFGGLGAALAYSVGIITHPILGLWFGRRAGIIFPESKIV